jgi:hypothetical protein
MQVNRAAFFALSLILAGSIYAENVIPRSRASKFIHLLDA